MDRATNPFVQAVFHYLVEVAEAADSPTVIVAFVNGVHPTRLGEYKNNVRPVRDDFRLLTHLIKLN